MRSVLTDLGSFQTIQRRFARGCQLLAVLVIFGCLPGMPTTISNALLAQPPMGPPAPEMSETEAPAIIDFQTYTYPGDDNWLISGQIVGCNDPSGIGVEIDGIISAGAMTDAVGYFSVLVNYPGHRESITANAEYNGGSLPQVVTSIGS